MLIEQPANWARAEIGHAKLQISQELGLGAFATIVRQAAQATNSAEVMVCTAVDGKLSVIVATEAGHLRSVRPFLLEVAHEAITACVVQALDDMPAIGFRGQNSDSVKFAAIALIPGPDLRFLIALDSDPRAELSAAQTYVLRSHAAHLATLFDLVRLQAQVDCGVGAENKAKLDHLRLLESVAVHARDSIIITEAEPIDLPGPRIIYCNAAFTLVTGYSAEEVLGKTPRILQGPKTDPAAQLKLRQAFEAWQPIEIELINYRKDGSEFWVELSIVPVADERGWFTHWVSVQRDITDRRNAQELTARVRVAEIENQVLASEIHERKRVEAELQYAAFHDSLTRLRNRSFFMKRLAQSLIREWTKGTTACSVLFLDLDRFKIVNDSLGHGEGDALLKEVAQRLRRCVRPQDTLARIGGDEFAVLIEDAESLATPVATAEAILDALRAPVQLGRQSAFPSCSIGVAHVTEPGVAPDELMRDADIAMYETKRAGSGDFTIFNVSMHAYAVGRLELQTDLRHALERKEFHLAYQPIVDPATGAVLSFEALLRWDHPVRGTVAPGDFIPIAEEIGIIKQIDRWVMREACSQLAQWQRRFADPALCMSINMSAAGFTDRDFVAALSSVLLEFDIKPCTLELEITEGIFLHPSPQVAASIATVRAVGVRIALDDFGTGYSSLSYINRYPIDTIKIDKSFIDGIGTSQKTLAIVELIVKLGAALDLHIIAEGVETQTQTDILMQIGCRAVQGYHFARPLSRDDAASALASWRPRSTIRGATAELPGD